MQRTLILTIAALLTLGLLAGAALAQGPGKGKGPPDHAGPPSLDFEVLSTNNYDRTSVSPGFGDDDNIVDSLELGEGDWLVTASGATNVGEGAEAPNCGLRLDADGTSTMIAKQNFADGDFEGRSGFSIAGAASVSGDADAHLLCYGMGTDGDGNEIEPFEYDLTAIGGD